jgi:hypothetical protein
MHRTEMRRSPKVHPANPLAVRAGLNRTFGSLAGFAALALLSLGIYLLADAFAHPVDAGAAALIVAALAIALAMLLFFFLFKPRKIPEMFPQQTFGDSSSREAVTPSRAPTVTARQDDLRKDLAYQRAYVDRSRIRP